MTRFLSESLNAPEPLFRRGLQQLEAANAGPSTDIRFSSEVMHATRVKMQQLGLDPDDTTPKELYQALLQQVAKDDKTLQRTLRTLAATHVSAEADVVAGMVHAIKSLPDAKRCYALKNSSLKALFKKNSPKKAMKQLGYRSVDSFLKHESPSLIIAAAWLVEGEAWQKRLLDQYKKLTTKDFESRPIQVLYPHTARWKQLAESAVADKRHNLLSFKELGAIVFLPLPAAVPDGATTVSFSLALHELNEIRATSAFLKFSQVRADFGKLVQMVAVQEAELNSQLLDRPVPWNLIQRYYAKMRDQFREDIFEPHLEQSDIAWHQVEDTLAAVEPKLGFWRHTAHLGKVYDREPVSCNIVDTALSYCNKLSFEDRASRYFQQSLWQELLLRYLHHGQVEQAVLAELQPAFATEPALA